MGDEDGKAAAQFRIGMLLFNEKRHAEAIKEYETLVEKFPGRFTGSSYHQIALSAFFLEDYNKSVASAQKGLPAPDTNQEIKTGLYYIMGLAYNKLDDAGNAITAFKMAVQSGEGTDKEQTKDTVFAAHRELARAYAATKQYEDSVKEYMFLAENSKSNADKAEAYFWVAKAYEDNLQDYQKSVDYYAKVKEFAGDDVWKAQALYFEGLIYTTNLKNDEKAVESFTELLTKFGSTTDTSTRQMVDDASLRIPDLLIKLGKFDDALARAKTARDEALTGTDKVKKVNAQYQLASLLGERASKASPSNPAFSTEAAKEFAEVYNLAKPLSETPDELKPLVAASLYNAGHLLYNLGGYDNYKEASGYLEAYVREFPKGKGDEETYSAALQLLSFTTYESARLKADLKGFETSAQCFLRFAKEFPKHKDAAAAQFQAGDAYYAVGGGHANNAREAGDAATRNRENQLSAEAYRKAIDAYRGVVSMFGNSEFAPEALYTMAASYAYLADALTDDAAKQREYDRMNAAYEELSQKYSKSKFAAIAFESVGNNYYNQAAAPGLAAKQKSDLYRQALKNYRMALQVPGVEADVQRKVEDYIKETEELLARDLWNAGYALVPPEGMATEQKKVNAPKAVALFEELIRTYPNTDLADLSYVQLGACYEVMEQWEDAEKAYGRLVAKYTDAKGNPVIPFSETVVQALQYAKTRRGQIVVYINSLKASKQQGGQ